MPPVKTGESPRLVKILARRVVRSRKRRTFLYRCEWDDDTWSWKSSKALERILCTLSFFDATLSNLTLLCSVVF